MNAYGNYPDLGKVKSILVIKLRHHGDVLLTSPVFSILRKRLPNTKIFAYIYQETLPMLEGHPAIDGFHLCDSKWKSLSLFQRVLNEIYLIRQIRENRFDMIINLTDCDRGDFVALVSRARYRVGLAPERRVFRCRPNVYTHIVKRCQKPRHMVEQNIDTLRRVGIFPSINERDLFIYIPQFARASIDRYLQNAHLNRHGYILIHPTSRWLFKCWPAEKAAELIQQLNRMGHRIVLSSAPDKSELTVIDHVISLCPDIPILNLAGKLSLKELAALIQTCGCLVSIDSVPMHIASALKVPTVALFGPSSEEAWGPWKNPHACVIAKNLSCRPCNLDGCGGSKVCDCLEQLPVGRVLNEVIGLLQKQQHVISKQ
jgi:heptosyltransferase-3